MTDIANIQDSVPRINLRRSTMSPMDPAGSARMKNGSAVAVWMSAICSGLLLSDVINHAAPTPCIKEPTSDAKSAIRRFRKSGMRRGLQGLEDAAGGLVLSGMVGHFINQKPWPCFDIFLMPPELNKPSRL